jgi:hypothetical protein
MKGVVVVFYSLKVWLFGCWFFNFGCGLLKIISPRVKGVVGTFYSSNILIFLTNNQTTKTTKILYSIKSK